tara:strand:+ start:1550 stop:2062 length:513 start_codon:yes stop_codon:yes gene_type:complete
MGTKIFNADKFIVDGGTSGQFLKADGSTQTITPLTTEEEIQDIVGAMVNGNVETNISVTYSDGDGKLNFAGNPTNTFLEAVGTPIAKQLAIWSTAGTLEGDSDITYNATTDTLTVGGEISTSQYNLTAMQTVPPTRGSTGVLGEIRINATGIYVCTATDTWSKVTLATSW